MFVMIMAMIVLMAMMLDMGLAGFGGMVMGVVAVARGAVGMVRRGLGVVILIMLGGLAMMVRRLFVMVGRVMMMLGGGMLVLGHGILRGCRPAMMAGRTCRLGADSQRQGVARGCCANFMDSAAQQ